jgi:hypothetical protein
MMGLDNQAVIKATQTRTPKPGGYLLDALDSELSAAYPSPSPDSRPLVYWTPGHVGIPDNEFADEEAKKAARGNTRCESLIPGHRLPTILQTPLPASRVATGQALFLALRKRAIAAFEDRSETGRPSPRCTRLRRINPSAPSERFRKSIEKLETPLRRRESTTLVQLRTGHFPLNRYLHTIGASPSPNCEHCGVERPETVFHYLMLCPKHNKARRDLRRHAPKATGDIAKLLTPGPHTKHLVTYIRDTKRFRSNRKNVVETQSANGGEQDLARARQQEHMRQGRDLWVQMGWATQPAAREDEESG